MRKDSDLLGEMQIADDLYYGIQTSRCLYLGDISDSKLHRYPEIIRTVAQIKRACVLANRDIGAIKPDIAEAIVKACDEVIEGKFPDSQFPVDMYCGGGAIAINMNLNELIANRANEILTGFKGYDRVHPNTHVNMCQSTNDVIPSAMKIVSYRAAKALLVSVVELESALDEKIKEFGDAVKLARTCLCDALPITFAQEFSGYLSAIRRQRQRIEVALSDWLALTLGGTAVGTGVGTMPGFIPCVYEHMKKEIEPGIRQEDNVFDGMQNADSYLYLSGLVKCLAVVLSKICYDLKMMGSGPLAGLMEIQLPPVQAGSSIMPGKVNPALPEMIIQVAQQVCGNDTTITMAVEKGELDLNIADQLLMKSLLDSCSLLQRALPIFTERCVKGIKINKDKTYSDAARSTALVTTVSMVHGYKKALRIALKAVETNRPVKEVAVESGEFTQEQADEFFDPLVLTSTEKMYQLLEKYKDQRDI